MLEEESSNEPLFNVVLRGYDRHEVEAHLQELKQRIAQAEEAQHHSVESDEQLEAVRRELEAVRNELEAARAGVAPLRERIAELESQERAPSRGGFEELGDSVAEVLRVAQEQSRTVLTKAETSAAQAVQDAQRRAAEIDSQTEALRNEAERDRNAADIELEAARVEAQRVREEAEKRAAELVADGENRARELLDKTYADATSLVEAARGEAERVRAEKAAELESLRRRVTDRVNALVAERQRVLDEMTRLANTVAQVVVDAPRLEFESLDDDLVGVEYVEPVAEEDADEPSEDEEPTQRAT